MTDSASGATAATARPPVAAPTEASAGELAAQIGQQVSRLVRDELALAQAEGKQKVKRVGIGIGMFSVAGLLGFFGVAAGLTTAILGLCNVLQPWLAALVVTAALFLVAGFIALPGWKGITKGGPAVPSDSVESVKADVDAVKNAARR